MRSSDKFITMLWPRGSAIEAVFVKKSTCLNEIRALVYSYKPTLRLHNYNAALLDNFIRNFSENYPSNNFVSNMLYLFGAVNT